MAPTKVAMLQTENQAVIVFMDLVEMLTTHVLQISVLKKTVAEMENVALRITHHIVNATMDILMHHLHYAQKTIV